MNSSRAVKFLFAVLLILIVLKATGTETTWRHPGFEVTQFDINYTGFNATNIGWLTFTANGTPPVSALNKSALFFNSNTNSTQVSENGSAYVDAFGNASSTNRGTLSNITYSNGVYIFNYNGNDTPTVQAAFNAVPSGGEIRLYGDMNISTINVGTNIRKISGTATIRQQVVPGNGLNLHFVNNVTVEGLTFIGQGGNFSVSNNSAIDIFNSSNILVQNNIMYSWRHEGVRVRNSTYVDVVLNKMFNNSHGIGFEGVQHGNIESNRLNTSQFNNFSAAIALQEYDFAIPPQHNLDIKIINNRILNYINAQGTLIHDGTQILISGNTYNNTLMGISVSAFTKDDNISQITISDNAYYGSNIFSYDTVGNYCINLDGADGDGDTRDITVSGNKCKNWNAAAKTNLSGAGIILHSVNRTIVSDNVLSSGYGTGIMLYGVDLEIDVHDNTVSDGLTTSPPNPVVSVGVYLTSPPDNLVLARVHHNTFRNLNYALYASNSQTLFSYKDNHQTVITVLNIFGISNIDENWNNRGNPPYYHGNAAAAPATYGAGDTYFNTVSNQLCIYTGAVWNNATGSTAVC